MERPDQPPQSVQQTDTGDSIRLAPLGEVRTAFVYLHSQSGPDFFADVPFAWTAGELRKDGRTADLIQVWFERGQPQRQAALIEELMATLAGGRYGLVVFEHLWLSTLIGRIQRELGALVCETDPDAVHTDQRVDFLLSDFTNNRQPLIDLVDALASGEDLLGVRNLVVHLDGQDHAIASKRSRQPHPDKADALRPFCPVLDPIVIGTQMDEQGEPSPIRKTLDTNKGCPFNAPVGDNPVLAQIDTSYPGLTLEGCAFCHMGGDYEALPWRQAVDIHLDQIAHYQRGLGRLDEVVLRDQHAIRYAPYLLQGAIDRGLEPFGLLLPGRGDAILRFGEAMAQAATIVDGSGFWFTIYLIGFESFSQPQLDLYNKGVTVAQYAEALSQMRALHNAHPGGFRLYAHGSSSFILFNPWTTLEDLEANVAFCRQHAVSALSRGLTATRLRLYPNLPLYWKARADDLLSDAKPLQDRGASATGYSAEATWTYRDGRIAVVESMQRKLLGVVRAAEEVGLLESVLRWVQQRWTMPLPAAVHVNDGATAEIARLETDLRDLQTLWREPAQAIAADSDATAQRRQRQQRAQPRRAKRDRTVLVGAVCNNRCQQCVADHAIFDDDIERLAHRLIEVAQGHERLVIAGREPTLLKGLPGAITAAREQGLERIEMVSNGRALANAGVAATLYRAGVTDLLLKRHRWLDEDEDLYTRAPGSGEQFWLGIERFRSETPKGRWRLLLVAVDAARKEWPRIIGKAAEEGARAVQITVPVAEVDLASAQAWKTDLEAALEAAEAAGLRCAIEGF